MEFTAPMRWRSLNAASALTFFTRSWQSSKTPRTAMLWMFGSCRELRIGKTPPARQINLRQALRHIQAAVRREPFEQDVGKALWLAAAAGADVEHGATSLRGVAWRRAR